MSDNITVNCVPFKDKYPTITLKVETIIISGIEENNSVSMQFNRFYYDEFSINRGNFKGVINKGISHMIEDGYTYMFWYSLTHTIEILAMEKLKA